MDTPHSLRAEIDLGAIRHNAALLRAAARSGAADLIAVVKADAYGHGADAVTAALHADGVRRFAVATLAEAASLRAGGWDGWLMLFAAPRPEILPAAERLGLAVTVSSRAVADDVIAYGAGGGALTVHVKVDTGMHRLGVAPGDAADVVARLQAASGVTVEGMWTHFATADGGDAAAAAFVTDQARRFQLALDALGVPPPFVHVLNGPALTRGTGALRLPAGARALARAGGALYGLRSDAGLDDAMADYRPAMRLVADIVHLQTVAVGETVSYGRTWRADRPTRIATLPAGYADGVPRGFSNRGEVGIGGRFYPVAGRVCMDMLMVDLGDPDGPGGAVALGDAAVLWGPGGLTAEDAAARAGTMAYELTAGLTARVARVAVGGFAAATS